MSAHFPTLQTKLSSEHLCIPDSQYLCQYRHSQATLPLNNKKLTVVGIFCDLEKAFDSVNHDTLLSKCEFYGFRGKTNALLRSYRIDRYQSVLLNNGFSNNNTFSEWGKMKHGVPQGSIPGPLFFLLYTNDLPNIIADSSKPVLFADDTNIIIANPSPSKFKEDINNIIDNINDWFRSNSLSLNFDKTYILQFRPKNTKFLGLGIDCSLSWKDHIDQTMFELGKACYAVRYVKHFMSQDALRTVLLFIFSFHPIIWHNFMG